MCKCEGFFGTKASDNENGGCSGYLLCSATVTRTFEVFVRLERADCVEGSVPDIQTLHVAAQMLPVPQFVFGEKGGGASDLLGHFKFVNFVFPFGVTGNSELNLLVFPPPRRKVIHSVLRLQCGFRSSLARRRLRQQHAALALTPAAKRIIRRNNFSTAVQAATVLSTATARVTRAAFYQLLLSRTIKTERLQAALRRIVHRTRYLLESSARRFLAAVVVRALSSRKLRATFAARSESALT